MDSINIRKIEIIVKDLLSEFEKEAGKLQAEYDDNNARIIEIEENIQNYKENEDVDFQVFSPRKIDNQNEEKIDAMNKEKERIEASNKSLYRQIKYYSDKTDKLNEILGIIEEDRKISSGMPVVNNEIIDDISNVDKKILAYYDSIAGTEDEEEDEYIINEKDNIGKEVKSGWRLIKEELSTPITSIDNTEDEEDEDDELIHELSNLTIRLESETRHLEEDYNKTKSEINSVLNDINSILNKYKK